jgi:hypothetical protein
MRTMMLVAAMTLAVTVCAAAAEPETKGDDSKAKLEASQTPEPVLCYRLLAIMDMGVPIGQAVELCAGSVDSLKTLKCFQEAYRHPDNDGLGLPLGLAVDLCRTIPRQ